MATPFERVVVTGANGFLGRALVRRLVQSQVAAVCTGRTPLADPPAGTRWIWGDLAQPGFAEHLVEEVRPDVLFHLASEVTGSRSIDAVRPTLISNLNASVNVLTAATKAACGRVVLIGSGDEPEGGAAPCSPYAAAKWAVGGYARMFHALYGTQVTTVRPFMVYGPDQPDVSKVVPYTITSLLRGQPPELSSGQRLCDWVYVDDVVDALLAAAVDPACVDRVVPVGSGELHTVRHVVGLIRDLVGGDVEPVFGPRPDRQRETEAVADIEEAARLCGWAPSTSLVDGLTRTVAWYR